MSPDILCFRVAGWTRDWSSVYRWANAKHRKARTQIQTQNLLAPNYCTAFSKIHAPLYKRWSTFPIK